MRHGPCGVVTLICLQLVFFGSDRFFIHAAPTTEIYTLSLHDALPICHRGGRRDDDRPLPLTTTQVPVGRAGDRSEEPRLNSSHTVISYAVFCLKKKNSARVAMATLSWRQPTLSSCSVTITKSFASTCP